MIPDGDGRRLLTVWYLENSIWFDSNFFRIAFINNSMTYYIVYETKNKINEKIYVGCHQTEDIDDGYLGSGKLLLRAIQKYGLENFNRKILKECSNKTSMFEYETEIVDEEFILREDTYNIKIGGNGGWYELNYGKNKHKNNRFDNEYLRSISGFCNPDSLSQEAKQKILDGCKKGSKNARLVILAKNENYFIELAEIGRKFIKDNFEEINEKRKNTYKRIKFQQGNRNSQYGTCWIHNIQLKKNKKIKKEELDTWISDDWIVGRKMKF